MSIFPAAHILDVNTSTSFTQPIGSSLLSIARLPTDPIYYADLDYTNFQVGSSYKTTYNDTQSVISTGTVAGDFTVNNVSANDTTEVIVTKARKYGYKEYSSTIAHSRAGAVIYGAQTSDSNVTDTLATVQGYISYNYDGIAKELTIPNNATINNAYDFGSYSAALLANIDYEYPLSTAIGINYIMPSGWMLITGNGLNNVNLTGDMRIDSVSDLTGLNLSGSLTFTVSGTYNLTNCNIDNVINTSGGSVIINSNNTVITTNSGQNITINNTKQFAFSINKPITGYEWRIYQVNALGSLSGAIELAGQESSNVQNNNYSYNYSVDIPIAVQIIGHANKIVESTTYYTLTNQNQAVNIILQDDTNG